jgi:salicylate hydroxylase
MNFAAVVESQSWKSDGWTTRGEPAELRRHLRDWHDDVQSMIAAIEEPYKWALIARTPLRQWTRGRATLLGDACHATLPFLAQGAVQAIEDGFVLSRAIAESDDIEGALLRYQDARVDRTVRMVEESIENGKRFHSPSLARSGEAERYVEKEWASARVGDRYDWLFDYDVVSAPI